MNRAIATTSFEKTLETMKQVRDMPWLILLSISLVFILIWILWVLLATIPLYVTSHSARLETQAPIYNITPAFSGKLITASTVSINDRVKEGDTLFILDTEERQIALKANQFERDSLIEQHIALSQQVSMERQAASERGNELSAAVDELEARIKSAQIRSDRIKRKAINYQQLSSLGTLSSAIAEDAKSEAGEEAQVVAALEHDLSRLKWTQQSFDSQHIITIQKIDNNIDSIDKQISIMDTRIQRIKLEIEQHFIRAPISGIIGHLAALGPGSMVNPGDILGIIIPEGPLQVVAYFSPEQAIGRVQPDQTARIIFEGFPPSQFGSFYGYVVQSEKEPNNGQLRVNISLDKSVVSRIPLIHGMPGAAEITIGRLSPFELILRSAGKLAI